MKAEITKEIKKAFDTDLADAVKPFVGVRQVLSDDDWLLNGGSKTAQEYQGRGVFSGFATHEIDDKAILRTDVKLIVLQDECELIWVGDSINEMDVIHVGKDPADVCYVVQLRGV